MEKTGTPDTDREWHLPEDDGADELDDRRFEAALRRRRREMFAALEALN